MEDFYNINQVAAMTGLTTRTVINYLKSGLVSGEKINGILNGYYNSLYKRA